MLGGRATRGLSHKPTVRLGTMEIAESRFLLRCRKSLRLLGVVRRGGQIRVKATSRGEKRLYGESQSCSVAKVPVRENGEGGQGEV